MLNALAITYPCLATGAICMLAYCTAGYAHRQMYGNRCMVPVLSAELLVACIHFTAVNLLCGTAGSIIATMKRFRCRPCLL